MANEAVVRLHPRKKQSNSKSKGGSCDSHYREAQMEPRLMRKENNRDRAVAWHVPIHPNRQHVHQHHAKCEFERFLGCDFWSH